MQLRTFAIAWGTVEIVSPSMRRVARAPARAGHIAEGMMPTIDMARDPGRAMARPVRRRDVARLLLLACGVLASLLYAAMLVLVPMRWEDYDSASQVVSELSAIDAPTRSLWVRLGIVYSVLMAAFGGGIWLSAGRDRRLRGVGALLTSQAIVGLFWPPMYLRGSETTLTDTMHIVFAMAWLLLMLLAIGFGAAAVGRRFRLYSVCQHRPIGSDGRLIGCMLAGCLMTRRSSRSSPRASGSRSCSASPPRGSGCHRSSGISSPASSSARSRPGSSPM